MQPELLSMLQIALGLVFLRSSVAKLTGLRAFFAGLEEYAIVPTRWVVPTGVAVVAAESAVAVAHLTGWLIVGALWITPALLLTFFVTAAHALGNRGALPCMCFGAADGEVLSKRSLGRIVVLGTVAAVLASYAAAGKDWPMPQEVDLANLIGLVIGAGLLIVVSSWLLSVSDFIALAKKCYSCAGKVELVIDPQ